MEFEDDVEKLVVISEEELLMESQDDVEKLAAIGEEKLLPKQSKGKYEAAYESFNKWLISNNCAAITEKSVLAYFVSLAEKYKPPTLWTLHSMLKSTIRLHDYVDLDSFSKVTKFLKNNASGYQPRKAKIFEPEHIQIFLTGAPDYTYLHIKVATVFALSGALRIDELVHVSIKDVIHKKDCFKVTIPKSKNKTARSFFITGIFYPVVKKYLDLRPDDNTITRFFVRYFQGKCTKHLIGINTFRQMPKLIAEYLKLEHSSSYTGHSFRRSSATFLADAGGDIDRLKRLGGWKSNAIAETYIENSDAYLNQTNKIITTSIDSSPGLVSSDTKKNFQAEYTEPELPNNSDPISQALVYSQNVHNFATNTNKDDSLASKLFSFTNCSNCNFTINIQK